jgi:hypothetical protein
MSQIIISALRAPSIGDLGTNASLTFLCSAGTLSLLMPKPVAVAMMAAFNAGGNEDSAALVSFIEELRDHKPEVISGRRRDPQDDTDDLMPVNEFEAFQADAEKLVGKKRKVAE